MNNIFALSILISLTTWFAQINGETFTSCNDATCTCIVAGDCVFDCATEDACKQSTLVCMAGQNCIVDCSAESACQDAVISGGAAVDVTVICGGEDSCKGNFEAYCGTGVCTFTCSESTSCEDGDIYTTSASSFSCTTPAYCNRASIYTGVSVTDAPETSEVEDTDAPEASEVEDTDEPDEEEVASVDSDSSSDDSVFAALFGRKNENIEDSGAEGKNTEHIVISFSDNAMMHIWALVIGFLVVNALLAYCFCFRKTKNASVSFETGGAKSSV